jgi:hypothetical protein
MVKKPVNMETQAESSAVDKNAQEKAEKKTDTASRQQDEKDEDLVGIDYSKRHGNLTLFG